MQSDLTSLGYLGAFLVSVVASHAPVQFTFWVILGRGLRFAVVIWTLSAALGG